MADYVLSGSFSFTGGLWGDDRVDAETVVKEMAGEHSCVYLHSDVRICDCECRACPSRNLSDWQSQ